MTHVARIASLVARALRPETRANAYSLLHFESIFHRARGLRDTSRGSTTASSVSPVNARRAFSTDAAAAPTDVYVVFGATGGIGQEVARKLHTTRGKDVKLVLGGRDEGKLSSLADELPGSVVLAADA